MLSGEKKEGKKCKCEKICAERVKLFYHVRLFQGSFLFEPLFWLKVFASFIETCNSTFRFNFELFFLTIYFAILDFF